MNSSHANDEVLRAVIKHCSDQVCRILERDRPLSAKASYDALTPTTLQTHASFVCANASQASASIPTIESVLRGPCLGPAFEVYVQKFKDCGLESLEDIGEMDVETLSKELIAMNITEFKMHANKMARELLKARPR